MIKLSKIYSNFENIFPEKKFKTGLNIIFGSVTKELSNKSSHSLGKTLLIDLIDYCLLKTIRKESFLKKKPFENFVFFLEIEVSTEEFITIRRVINGKISIARNNNKGNYSSNNNLTWEVDSCGLTAGKKKLNQLINPKPLSKFGFHYRNGLRYCLRKQTQYEDTFKVNSSREGDASWKPYLAGILGIAPEIVIKKYDINKKVESIKNAVKEIRDLPEDSSQGLEAEIAQIEIATSRMKKEVDKFDFSRSDESVSKELIEEVSQKVVDITKAVYSIDQKLSAIKNSLETKFSFDLNKVIELFEDVKIYFPEKLHHSYEDLVKLNTEMSSGRRGRLKLLKNNLQIEREDLSDNLKIYRKSQQKLTAILLEKDAFEKYKKLQSRLSIQESRLAVLRERLHTLDTASQLEDKLLNAQVEQKKAEKKLEKETRIASNERLKTAVEIFSSLVDDILSISAFFYSSTNKSGNIEFKIGLEDQTSLNDGFSYTRILSAIFDVSLLLLYKKEDFYKFSYHDGLLESLDDRVKLKLIKTWRGVSEKNNIQLIMSVLDSDLPISNKEKKYFKENEVIRELHDRGNSGRLFKMDAF